MRVDVLCWQTVATRARVKHDNRVPVFSHNVPEGRVIVRSKGNDGQEPLGLSPGFTQSPATEYGVRGKSTKNLEEKGRSKCLLQNGCALYSGVQWTAPQDEGPLHCWHC